MNMILGDFTKHIHFWWVPLILNKSMGFFFSPYANIMPIDFAIRRKYGVITEHKMLIELLFLKFLLHIHTELFALLLVIRRYGLNKLQFAVCITKRFLGTW